MRELPPESLMVRLVELRLCTAAEVQRARSRVRKMTRDLPAFDSVWIDALVQRGVLTPFQGRWLEQAPPESLVADDFVLLEGLGAGTASHIFLARSRDRRRRVVLKRLSIPADQLSATEQRLSQMLDRCRMISSPYLALPSELVRTPQADFVLSSYVAGMNLAELLVRRGRFPAAVVIAIADQVFSALSALHAAGVVHGDVRLKKLRLTRAGHVVLVESGLRPALTPELLVHGVRSAEEADVIAPERIGTNLPANAASDLYAAGCVFWQLLTGRPPYPQADPLTKLAAHQTRRIEDVRELAPETPPQLAALILELTAASPQDRPRSAEEARRRLGSRRHSQKQELIRFRRQFDVTVPHLATKSVARPRRWQVLVATIFLLGLATVVMSDRGLRSELLEIAQKTWSSDSLEKTIESDVESASRRTSSFSEIPEPDARGVITLTEAGPYIIRELSTDGPLTIQAAKSIRPVIRIEDEPWRITAQQVAFKNLEIEWHGSNSLSGELAMLELRTQRAAVSGCLIRGIPPSAFDESNGGNISVDHDETEKGFQPSSPLLSAICWEPQDARDPQVGNLLIENSQLMGAMHGLKCRTSPLRITWRNVLKTNAGSALVVDDAESSKDLKIVLQRITLRDSGPLLTCSGPLIETNSAVGIEISAADSVLAVRPSHALVELRGPKVRDDWPQEIRLLGDGSLLPPNTSLLAVVDSEQGIRSSLESDELQFEGLFIDEFQFSGQLSNQPADSVVIETHAPRRQVGLLPGFTAK